MTDLFIQVRFLDIIDIFLVAIIFYEIYKLVKGTVAFNIFMGIFIIFVVWLMVKSLKMELLGSILGELVNQLPNINLPASIAPIAGALLTSAALRLTALTKQYGVKG